MKQIKIQVVNQRDDENQDMRSSAGGSESGKGGQEAGFQITSEEGRSLLSPRMEFTEKEFLLRGVSLRPQDEFKESRQRFSSVSSSDEPIEDSSVPLNMRLKQQRNASFYGP